MSEELPLHETPLGRCEKCGGTLGYRVGGGTSAATLEDGVMVLEAEVECPCGHRVSEERGEAYIAEVNRRDPSTFMRLRAVSWDEVARREEDRE